MKLEVKYILNAVLCLIVGLLPVFAPPWSDKTGFMPYDNFFEAFFPGQFVTTPLFLYLCCFLIYKLITHKITMKEIEKLRKRKDRVFIK